MSILKNTSYSAHRRTVAGLALALFTAACFGSSGTFADALMSSGWSPGSVVTARICLAAVVLTVPALIQLRGRWGLLRAGAPAMAAFGLIAVAGCQLFYFNAVRRLDVGVALLLEYSGIVLVVLWLWLRHDQRPRRLTLVGIGAAVGGLLLVLNPGAGSLDPIGLLWGGLAAVGLAVFFVLAARIGAGIPPLVLAWVGMMVGAVTLVAFDLLRLLPTHANTRDVRLHGQAVSWLVPVVGLGVVAAAIAYTAGIGASRLLGAKVASFVGLTEVLFGVLFAAVVLGQQPSRWQLLGGLIVLFGVGLVQADERVAAAPAAEPSAPAEPTAARPGRLAGDAIRLEVGN